MSKYGNLSMILHVWTYWLFYLCGTLIDNTIFYALLHTFYYCLKEIYRQYFFHKGDMDWNNWMKPFKSPSNESYALFGGQCPRWLYLYGKTKKFSFLIITQDHDRFALVVWSIKRKVLVSIHQFMSRNIRNTRFPDTGGHNGYPIKNY